MSFWKSISNAVLKPVAKVAKPYLKKWAKSDLIPLLQKVVNAGAIDKQVDAAIEKAVLDAINKI